MSWRARLFLALMAAALIGANLYGMSQISDGMDRMASRSAACRGATRSGSIRR